MIGRLFVGNFGVCFIYCVWFCLVNIGFVIVELFKFGFECCVLFIIILLVVGNGDDDKYVGSWILFLGMEISLGWKEGWFVMF